MADAIETMLAEMDAADAFLARMRASDWSAVTEALGRATKMAEQCELAAKGRTNEKLTGQQRADAADVERERAKHLLRLVRYAYGRVRIAHNAVNPTGAVET